MHILRFFTLIFFLYLSLAVNAQENVKNALELAKKAEELFEKGEYTYALNSIDKSITLLEAEGMSPPSRLVDLRIKIKKKYDAIPKKVESSSDLAVENKSLNQKPTSSDSSQFVVENYIEAIGGASKWRKLIGIKRYYKTSQNEISTSLSQLTLNDGRYHIKSESNSGGFNFEYVAAFNGTQEWTKMSSDDKITYSDDEKLNNTKAFAKEGLCPYLDYKTKGISLKYMGREELNGVQCYKVEVGRKRTKSDGSMEEVITYSWFRIIDNLLYGEEFVLNDGSRMKSYYLAYKTVEGIQIPCKIKNSLSNMTFEYDSIEVVNTIDSELFNP